MNGGGIAVFPTLSSLPTRLATRGFSKVIVRDLGVVLDSHFRRVPQPCANDVDGELFQKLGFAARPQILKELWPRLDLGILENPAELRPQVDPVAPAAADDPWRVLRCL